MAAVLRLIASSSFPYLVLNFVVGRSYRLLDGGLPR